jgi:hypothetical protein
MVAPEALAETAEAVEMGHQVAVATAPPAWRVAQEATHLAEVLSATICWGLYPQVIIQEILLLTAAPAEQEVMEATAELVERTRPVAQAQPD